MAKPARAHDEQARSYSRLELTAVFLSDLRVYDHQGSRSLILEVLKFVSHNVFSAGFQRFLNEYVLCPVEQRHRIELWQSRNFSDILEQISAMGYSHGISWETCEFISQLVCEVEMLSVLAVLLEADSERVENSSVVGVVSLIWRDFECKKFIKVKWHFSYLLLFRIFHPPIKA